MAQQMFAYTKEQPRVWKQIVDKRKSICKKFIDSYRKNPIERVVMLGSGSSNIASDMAKELYEKLLGIEVTVAAPTRMSHLISLVNADKTAFWAISQSGESTSTIQAIEELHNSGFCVTAVTSDAQSPIAVACDSHVMIECGEEVVGPKTKGMTSTALTLFLMGLELALQKGSIDSDEYEKVISDLYRSFEFADKTIADSVQWSKENSASLQKAPHIIIVADGMNLPVAMEGALKMLETLYIPVVSYEFEEYLHGVQNTINMQSYLFFLISDSHNRERMLKLYDFCEEHGSHDYIISTGTPTGKANELNLASSGNELTLPFESLLPFHVISALISEDKGINCDKPQFKDFVSKMETKLNK